MLCFRGVDTTNPIHKTSSGNNELTTSEVISLTMTPTIPNCMLVFISCFSDDDFTPDSSNYSGWTTSSLSGITEVIDNATSDGSYDKGGFACAYGLQTSAAYVNVKVIPDYIPHTFHYFVMALTQGEPPLSISIKEGSVWKDGTPFVKVGGVWKPVEKIYEKIGGVWKS